MTVIMQVHALIISHLKKEMPSMFGKKKKQEALLNNLEQEFLKIQQRHHLPPGDFPNPAKFKQNLALYDMDKFKSLKEDLLDRADEVCDDDHDCYIMYLNIVFIYYRHCQLIFHVSCLDSPKSIQSWKSPSAIHLRRSDNQPMASCLHLIGTFHQ